MDASSTPILVCGLRFSIMLSRSPLTLLELIESYYNEQLNFFGLGYSAPKF